MADDKTTQKDDKPEKSDAVKQAQKDSLSPEQKHKNYLDLLEKLHGEP